MQKIATFCNWCSVRASASHLPAAFGLISSLAVSRLMGRLLFEVKAYDRAVFFSVPLFLLGIVLIATYLPARRAIKIDPIVALREP